MRPAGASSRSGTTVVRLLESAARPDGTVEAFAGEVDLFIEPGYRFKTVDLMLTNFHLPRSTLFMLVCAFAGTERMKAAYAEALAAGYRFYSYGDACLLARGESVVSLGFTVEATDGRARLGRLETAHGPVHTPAFMPVGTQAAVKGLTVDTVRASGAKIVLANTYHLMIRPGADRIARLGGLHEFMNWPGPILTDSGGFQVMSLAQLRTVQEDGVVFRAHTDGSRHHLTPAGAVEIQHALDSDITMVLDECTPYPASEDEAAESMRRSMRWAARCKEAFVQRPGYGLFGIVQGSVYPELRSGIGGGARGDRLRRLRRGRARGGRRAGPNAGGARRARGRVAGGAAALPDGSGHAG